MLGVKLEKGLVFDLLLLFFQLLLQKSSTVAVLHDHYYLLISLPVLDQFHNEFAVKKGVYGTFFACLRELVLTKQFFFLNDFFDKSLF
jgi:hypothetical protein